MRLFLDSPVYLDLLRNGVDVRQRLLGPLSDGNVYSCGIVRAEVLRGIRHPVFRDEMEAFFDLVPEVPLHAKLWREVASLGLKLDSEGRTPPVTILAIAACAMRVGATLISPGHHFEGIPGLSLETELPES